MSSCLQKKKRKRIRDAITNNNIQPGYSNRICQKIFAMLIMESGKRKAAEKTELLYQKKRNACREGKLQVLGDTES